MYYWAHVTVMCKVHRTYADCSNPYVNEFKCSGFVSTLNWSVGMSWKSLKLWISGLWLTFPNIAPLQIQNANTCEQNDNVEIVNASIRQFIILTNTNCNLLGPALTLCAQLFNVWIHTQHRLSSNSQSEMTTSVGASHPRWCRTYLGQLWVQNTQRIAAGKMRYVSSLCGDILRK